MKLLRVYGLNDKLTKPEIRDAVTVMAGKIIDKSILDKLSVTVHCKPELWDGDIPLDGELSYVAAKHIRKFRISISNKISRERQLKVLGHEIAHIKQFVAKELVDVAEDTKKWKSRVYNEAKHPYDYLPYEIEARGYEEALYNTYLEYVESLNVSRTTKK